MKIKLLLITAISIFQFASTVQAQQEKIRERIYTGSVQFLLRREPSGTPRFYSLAAQADYQWKFSKRFSIGGVGGFNYFTQRGLNYKNLDIYIAPESRYWFPTKINRISPFLHVYIGIQTSILNGDANGIFPIG
ncbi:MAG: DUF3575 domain-containing protein, partial [Bacteroidia bacterium]